MYEDIEKQIEKNDPLTQDQLDSMLDGRQRLWDELDDKFKTEEAKKENFEIKSTFGRMFSSGDKRLTALIVSNIENDMTINITVCSFSDSEIDYFKEKYPYYLNKEGSNLWTYLYISEEVKKFCDKNKLNYYDK